MAYRVEEIGELDLQTRLNEIEQEGFVLVSVSVHGIITEDGRPLFVTVWKQQ